MSPSTEPSAVLPLIRTLRGQRVILDSDLARLYGVPTKRLNQQVRRNLCRFPQDFAFRLTPHEARMRSQIVTASNKRNLSAPPLAFTEYGVVMAANILNSERAIVMSVEVVRAFIRLRKAALSQDKIAKKMAELERAVAARLDRQDSQIEKLFRTLGGLISAEPATTRKRIGFRPEDARPDRARCSRGGGCHKL